MKKTIISLLCLAVFSLSGCASKIPNTKMDRNGNYVPQTDYQAYALAKSHEPKTFDTFSLEGAEFIKIKGKHLKLSLTDEFKQPSTLARPKSWFERTMDSVDKAFPIVGKVAVWWMGFDFGKDVVDGLAKDPVIVEQRHDTVTSHDTVTETVEVVEQERVEIIEVGDTYNGDVNQGTINNNPEPVVEDPVIP
jgi:hypothetical protein